MCRFEMRSATFPSGWNKRLHGFPRRARGRCARLPLRRDDATRAKRFRFVPWFLVLACDSVHAVRMVLRAGEATPSSSSSIPRQVCNDSMALLLIFVVIAISGVAGIWGIRDDVRSCADNRAVSLGCIAAASSYVVLFLHEFLASQFLPFEDSVFPDKIASPLTIELVCGPLMAVYRSHRLAGSWTWFESRSDSVEGAANSIESRPDVEGAQLATRLKRPTALEKWNMSASPPLLWISGVVIIQAGAYFFGLFEMGLREEEQERLAHIGALEIERRLQCVGRGEVCLDAGKVYVRKLIQHDIVSDALPALNMILMGLGVPAFTLLFRRLMSQLPIPYSFLSGV